MPVYCGDNLGVFLGIEWKGRLLLSDRAHLVFDFHQIIDGLNEKELEKGRYVPIYKCANYIHEDLTYLQYWHNTQRYWSCLYLKEQSLWDSRSSFVSLHRLRTTLPGPCEPPIPTLRTLRI